MISPPRLMPRPFIINPFSFAAMGGHNPTLNDSPGLASAAWPSANLAVFYPFILSEPATARSMFLSTGSTGGDSFDAGIYRATGARLVSSGATAHPASSTILKFTISATALPAGEVLYAALACNGTTSTVSKLAPINGLWQLRGAGMLQMASAYTLPSSATFAAVTTATFVPMFGVSFVSTY